MMNIENFDWDRLDGLGFAEETKQGLRSACWKGYEAIGMKNKNGRKVPNCVKVKSDAEHKEGDIATAEMTPNFLPKKDIPGGGDLKTPRMAEAAQRMPRDTVLKKLNDKDGLAMEAAPNFNEEEHDAFHSEEPNAGMIITQLRVIREKADIMLGMLYPDDNLEPWCFTKIANAGVAMASVADYLRFGGET